MQIGLYRPHAVELAARRGEKWRVAHNRRNARVACSGAPGRAEACELREGGNAVGRRGRVVCPCRPRRWSRWGRLKRRYRAPLAHLTA
jgi:hypothetical protein